MEKPIDFDGPNLRLVQPKLDFEFLHEAPYLTEPSVGKQKSQPEAELIIPLRMIYFAVAPQ